MKKLILSGLIAVGLVAASASAQAGGISVGVAFRPPFLPVFLPPPPLPFFAPPVVVSAPCPAPVVVNPCPAPVVVYDHGYYGYYHGDRFVRVDRRVVERRDVRYDDQRDVRHDDRRDVRHDR